MGEKEGKVSTVMNLWMGGRRGCVETPGIRPKLRDLLCQEWDDGGSRAR